MRRPSGRAGGEILALAEQRFGAIHRISYELLAAGATLAARGGLSCALLAPPGLPADELIRRGADRLYYLEHGRFALPEEDMHIANLVALMRRIRPRICLIGATEFGRALASGAAAALGAGLTADCVGLEIGENGNILQIRPAFNDHVLAAIETVSAFRIATVRYREYEEMPRGREGAGEIVRVPVVFPAEGRVRLVGAPSAEGKDISDAEIVVAGGAGLEARDIPLLERLAVALGGVVAGSRRSVELGLLPPSAQVGYSGRRVKPRLYVACGISGAPQHLSGMNGAEYVVAVNKDAGANIFRHSDFGIVGDFRDVAPPMIDMFAAARRTGAGQ
ncbi:MAG: electron transfer flavoprotein subunit alpha/FixB family protein [Clostridiales Family XIII bacterium]|jgi:electron transfer flavoprotein alpha subunit|nr:electron transfer flavoprotein subunit alpha/FixB family protein [Clostridiales Family XIII bacterium]